MEKICEYQVPEFKVIKYKSQDVITTSGEITPPWGGEVVTDPEFPEIGL
ncbi:MAG: hypothetical protein J5964_06845 [Eubacterium sp.]|nr:hypothetical protein [Eubacterium sp.]